jgi:predicted histidine transporter YuiF (NhaC family)
MRILRRSALNCSSIRNVINMQSIFIMSIGMFVGSLFAFCCFYEFSIAPRSYYQHIQSSISDAQSNTDTITSIHCIVAFAGIDKTDSKYLSAIDDTYAKRCNATIYYTMSKKLQKNNEHKLSIYHVDKKR